MGLHARGRRNLSARLAGPGRPTVTIEALDNGEIISGGDAQYQITVNPAPTSGETRRVYLKTWEVFINAMDPIPDYWDLPSHCEVPGGVEPSEFNFNPDIHCDPPPRRGDKKVQFEAYTHVDVGSSGTAIYAIPSKVFRSTEDLSGRNYWTELQPDVAYSVAGDLQAEVVTTVFDPDEVPCWFGHSHYEARMIRVDGMLVYSPAGMGITECLSEKEIKQMSSSGYVWTSCKPEYSHANNMHPYTHAGHTHHHHNPQDKLVDGSCATGQSQTLGQDSQDDGSDEQQTEEPFPDSGALGFSDVTASSMTLSWSKREVDRYLVLWAENVENAETHEAEVDAGTLTYTITGLEADTEYAVIVYSQDYDEVTPTTYQRTAAAAATCDTADAESKARSAFDWHTNNNGPDEGLFWRILNTLGAANLPAKPSDVTHETVAAQSVEDYSDGKGWAGWDPIVEALECVEGAGSAQQDATPPATPEVSVTAGSGITEGGNATFTVTASPAPAANLDVAVAITQSGDYGASTGSQTVTIPTSGSATLTVATVNDSVDEANGSVTATVNGGTGYTVSTTAGAATVAVADDDATPDVTVSIADASGPEDRDLKFTVTLSKAVNHQVRVRWDSVMDFSRIHAAICDNDFFCMSGWLTFAPGETSRTGRVWLQPDSRPESDEEFLVQLSQP